ncbi:MAG: ABC transporter permease [bacterium]|nr:ABC transporter permease [bacterium]
MTNYIIRRILLAIPTLIMITMLIFAVVRFIPGNVIDLMVSEMSFEAGIEKELTAQWVREKLGMDVPVYVQYGRWVGGVLHGDFGSSLWTDESITDELRRRIPVSAELGIIALITSTLISLPVGIFSAVRQDTLADYGGRTLAILSISLPSFWLATMVMVYPAIYWGWSPPVQYIPLAQNPLGNLGQFMIPGFIMGMVQSGTTMRMTRTMMLEVLRQDYIRTAWAKGLNERTIIVRHALKNALIPVVTLMGAQVHFLVTGSVILETIFALPGVGLMLIEALNKRDYPVISAINFLGAIVVLGMNLIVDVTYGFLDPRISYK